ncbi:HEAT repeat domain-containing protein [Microcoleus sp. FACHB-672]|uniref:HEAT repeat domain-containing protein n=1 Tax=Microcoleus sp. FACHB-672 TaxID=2692825 RepID=UPI001F54E4E0|nr:HEAT repeat domain-containing protein [Microcoleus sp. FACHB-672]
MFSDAIMTKDESIQKLIQAVDEADSADGLLNAVKALAAVRSPAAIPSLIQVLRYNNPGAAVAAVDGLILLGEPAVQAILDQLDSYNYGARAWAVRALAGIGDPRGIDLLISAAETDFALSVRRAAARGLGNLQWVGLSSELVRDDQERTYNTLSKVCQDPEWVVRYAGIVGLQGLGSAVPADRPAWFSQLLAQLQQMAQADAELVVRARAVLATQTLTA